MTSIPSVLVERRAELARSIAAWRSDASHYRKKAQHAAKRATIEQTALEAIEEAIRAYEEAAARPATVGVPDRVLGWFRENPRWLGTVGDVAMALDLPRPWADSAITGLCQGGQIEVVHGLTPEGGVYRLRGEVPRRIVPRRHDCQGDAAVPAAAE